MGYSMSRFEMDSELCDGGKGNDGVSATQTPNESFAHPNHEIAHLTNLRSCPSEHLSRVLPGRREINVSTVKMLAGREGNYSGRGRFSSSDCCHIVNQYLPVHGPLRVDKMNTRAYVSQFSDDGSLFVAGFQGSHIRIYDVDRGWKVHKDILAKNLRWTITDSSLSPDRCYLAYASMSPIVHIVNARSAATESIANFTEIHEGLDFSDEDDGEYSFGIFSVKFSTDGRELVAGTNNKSIYVYDIGANKLTLRIPAHASDVNSVCFADETGHLIYSGSDDNLCKVWDRRCFSGRGQPAGVLSGHLEGITFLNTRGDGRYFISNGKDQTIKLWDIRRMSSKATICGSRLKNFEWDYRWMAFPVQAREWKHPNDQSLATYRGHAVLRTLIRCYFSPAYSTGQKYIYTGSNDGCVYIYDLVSGAQVARPSHHRMTVRDCSWHPFNPVLVSSSWDGSIVKWEFPGKEELPSPLGRKKSRR